MTSETTNVKVPGDARIESGTADSMLRNRHNKAEADSFKRWFEEALNTNSDIVPKESRNLATNRVESEQLHPNILPLVEAGTGPDIKTLNRLDGKNIIGENAMGIISQQGLPVSKEAEIPNVTTVSRSSSTAASENQNRTSNASTRPLFGNIWRELSAFLPHIVSIAKGAQGIKIWIRNRNLNPDQIGKIVQTFKHVFEKNGMSLAQITINGETVYATETQMLDKQNDSSRNDLNRIY